MESTEQEHVLFVILAIMDKIVVRAALAEMELVWMESTEQEHVLFVILAITE